MKYAKILNKYSISLDIPKSAFIDRKLIGGNIKNPVYLARLGFYPLIISDKPIGNYRAIYELKNDQIIQSWEKYEIEEEIKPVYKYSKYKIIKAVINLGLLNDFYESMTIEAKALWDSAMVLSSDDEFFISISANLKNKLNISNEEFNQILEQCLVD